MAVDQLHTALGHLPAILVFLGFFALYVFYALFVVAGVVLAVDYALELLHRLLTRMTGRAQ
jgi:hypothetical protein